MFNQMLQNAFKKKTRVVFSFFISSNFTFCLMNALVYVDIDQGIHKGKVKLLKMKNEKNYLGFLFI